MYDELINRLRAHQCDAGEDDTQDFCEECQYDVIIADKSTFSGIRKVCVCGLMNEAADAIEHMQKTILRLENELGIYDDLPMVDQREPPKENMKPQRWKDVYHWGFGYTVCPYCGNETEWYNPVGNEFQSDVDNNLREYCPKCHKRVYAREGLICNQPPKEEA